jgi:hypothetical protein
MGEEGVEMALAEVVEFPGSGASERIGPQILAAGERWHRSQYDLVVLAALLDESDEWVLVANTAAHWIADALDIAVSTAREWVRIGRVLRDLPALDAAFAGRRLSYSKVRAVSRVATVDNVDELVEIAESTPASRLGVELARFLKGDEPDEDRDQRHHDGRSLKTWTDADGMVHGHFRLPPLLAAIVLAVLDALVMRASRSVAVSLAERGENASADASSRYRWPSMAQQRADALVELAELAEAGQGMPASPGVAPEIVIHVDSSGCHLDDGTPLTETDVERIAPHSFIRALVHDAERRPINASGRQRHPTMRQKRVVLARDKGCVDCGSHELIEFDHVPDYAITGRTVVEELVARCGPCHRRRHRF